FVELVQAASHCTDPHFAVGCLPHASNYAFIGIKRTGKIEIKVIIISIKLVDPLFGADPQNTSPVNKNSGNRIVAEVHCLVKISKKGRKCPFSNIENAEPHFGTQQ